MTVHDQLVRFACEGQTLYGNLAVPKPGAPCILMSHGFEASKDGIKWSYLAPKLQEKGYATFRFNYRGCGDGLGKSEGNFEDTTLTRRIKDFKAAVGFLDTTSIDANRIAVIGSSFGGEVPVAAQDPRIKGLVLLATPSRAAEIREEELLAVREKGYFKTPTGKRLKLEYFEDAKKYDLLTAISRLTCPILIIHGSLDDDVPVESAYELYRSAKGPKRLEIVQEGRHALRRQEDMSRILQWCIEWFEQYL